MTPEIGGKREQNLYLNIFSPGEKLLLQFSFFSMAWVEASSMRVYKGLSTA